jgi:hypothetical protein
VLKFKNKFGSLRVKLHARNCVSSFTDVSKDVTGNIYKQFAVLFNGSVSTVRAELEQPFVTEGVF